MSWLDDQIKEDMKNPKYKAASEKWDPQDKVIRYMLDNNIPFTQEFLDVLDELTEKGVIFNLVEYNKVMEKKELEYA